MLTQIELYPFELFLILNIATLFSKIYIKNPTFQRAERIIICILFDAFCHQRGRNNSLSLQDVLNNDSASVEVEK